MAVTSRRPTSADVARLAGVSRATVSYVLNDQPGQSIPEVTRTRVLDAARDLGYTPNAAAKALRAGRSNIVMLVARGTPYGRNLGLLVDRLAERVAEHDMSLIVWEPAAVGSLRTTLGHIQPRLVLSVFQLEPAEIEALRVAGIPCASAEPSAGASLRDELIGSLQVRHLAERGHRALGHLGTADEDVAAFAGPRRAGARRGCLELGLPAPAEAEVTVPPRGTIEEVAAVLADWHAAGVTGVAAYNDYLAAACVRAAAGLGLRIPDDLAVIGVDDDPMSALLDPPLSTVRMDLIGIADRLLRIGLQSTGQDADLGVEPPDASSHVEVVARGST